MPEEPTRLVPGRAVVARRALQEIVRDAATGSYGVTGLTEPTLWAHVRARLGMGSRAIHVTVRPVVAAEVWLTVAYGVPVAEVARQVDSAGLRRRIDRPPVREPMHDDMPPATDHDGSGRAPGTA